MLVLETPSGAPRLLLGARCANRYLIGGTAGGHAGQGGDGQDGEVGEGFREKGAGALDLEGSVGIDLAHLGHWELLRRHTCSGQPPAPISVTFSD